MTAGHVRNDSGLYVDDVTIVGDHPGEALGVPQTAIDDNIAVQEPQEQAVGDIRDDVTRDAEGGVPYGSQFAASTNADCHIHTQCISAPPLKFLLQTHVRMCYNKFNVIYFLCASWAAEPNSHFPYTKDENFKKIAERT